MTQTVSRITPAGVLSIAGELDEVTRFADITTGSIFFPTSSYLGSGSALTLGTTCTFECWFRTTANPATSKFVLLGGSGNRGLNIYNGAYGQSNYSATVIQLDWETADNRSFTVPTMTANTWYHLAVTFNAGTATLWLNGTRSSTGTVVTGWNFQSQIYKIGAWPTQSTYSQGVYISNARLTTTAVYDISQTTITVPTSPLTAITGTQLLLNTPNNANYLKDSSSNNITMTVTGSASSSTTSPFFASTIRLTPSFLYSSEFDEVTLNPIQNGLAKREYRDGRYQVAGYFDEYTGFQAI
jgi:hypothetical protein